MDVTIYVMKFVFWCPWNLESSYTSVPLVAVNSAEDAQLTPLLRLGAGACAGIIAMSATYPMDMVRGRLTVQVLS